MSLVKDKNEQVTYRPKSSIESEIHKPPSISIQKEVKTYIRIESDQERKERLVQSLRKRLERKKQEDQEEREKQQALVAFSQNENVKINQVSQTKIINAFAGKRLTWRNTLNCGECEGLNNRAIRFETVCSKQGIQKHDKVCKRYSPLPPTSYVVSASESNALFDFGQMLAVFDTSKLQHMIGLIWAEKTNRKYGFRFFQKLYYRWRGCGTDNYYSNFVVGYLITATDKYIRLIDRNAKALITIDVCDDSDVLDAIGPSLYSEEAFREMEQAEWMKGKIDSETIARNRRAMERASMSSKSDERTIDSEDGLSDKAAKPKRRKKEDTDDILSPVSSAESGDSDNSSQTDQEDQDIILGVDDLLETQPQGSKYKVKPVKQTKGKVRDLCDIADEMSKAIGRIDMGYYEGQEDEESVIDSGLAEYEESDVNNGLTDDDY